ncbi:MAG: DegT/DnrJ/EryC1/StrS family aminotransferase [Clostridiales bacterium]|jgi:dTDP-4-amino-4,6-dideoxygalactose transaminase|nr:DegT/DnrJ/EryC1/StrS family aminotransferase [Clostridiales bacterium]
MASLAVNGGTPVRTKPFTEWPIFGKSDEDALINVLRSGAWGRVSGGKKNEELEERFAQYHDAKYGVTCVNGTVALEIALKAMGIGEGDEVIVPAYTFIATASAAVMVGAIPKFVDIDPNTYNIDPSKIEEAITPNTKAIIPVHIGGCPANMDGILAVAKKYGLMVLEDAAQAVGAEWRGKKVGAIGEIGTFSFQASKNLNAGEGGIIITNDPKLADMAWSLMNVGRVKSGGWYDHPILGWNYRMTEFQAALVLSQMERLEEQMRLREENADYLSKGLHQIGGVEPLVPDEGVSRHAYHLYIFRYCKDEFGGIPKEKFLAALQAEGIPASSGYLPLYRFPALVDSREKAGYDKLYLPVTEKACYEEGVWLLHNVLLGSKADMDDIVNAVAKIKAHIDELK